MLKPIEKVFQFHNGSIKSPARLDPPSHPTAFQFHNGSIKRKTAASVSEHDTSFNSTMVRLKAQVSKAELCTIASFNSTMVRLKADRIDAGGQIEFEFQFHNGSIKRIPDCALSSMNSNVSIPQWFD